MMYKLIKKKQSSSSSKKYKKLPSIQDENDKLFGPLDDGEDEGRKKDRNIINKRKNILSTKTNDDGTERAPSPPLMVEVQRWDGSVQKLPAHMAVSNVTGTSFKNVNVLKRQLRKRGIKLSTGLRGDARIRELSRRLEKAILTEQAKIDRRNGKDVTSQFKERLKLIDQDNVIKHYKLMDAAILRSDMLHVTTLISRGAVPANYIGPMEFTPLIRAAFVGDVDAIERCIQLGANPDFKNKFYETPLLWVCSMNDGDKCVGAMLGGAFNDKNIVDAKEAERRKKAMSADINLENRYGVLPLFAACECGNLKTVEQLIKFGVKVNKANRFGMTSLMVAGRFGHEQICYTLLQAGAKLETRDKTNRNCEMWAREAGYIHLADVLKREAWRWAKKQKEEEEELEIKREKPKKKKKVKARDRLWRILRMKAKMLKMSGEWQVLWDNNSGKEFYYNATTNVTQWEKPPSIAKKEANTWHVAYDQTNTPYYYNDAGVSTYEKPAILDDSWKNKKAKPTTWKEIEDEINEQIKATLKSQGKESQYEPFQLSKLARDTDGYLGVARIKIISKLLAADRVGIVKREWDNRRGAIVGKQKASVRCLEENVRCEFCNDCSPLIVCVPCDALFCTDCMRSSFHNQRYPHHRCVLISQIKKQVAINKDKSPDRIRPQSKSKMSTDEFDDDDESSEDENSSSESDDNDDVRKPMLQKKKDKKSKKTRQNQLKLNLKKNQEGKEDNKEAEKGDEDSITIPPQPKDREYRKTLNFQLDKWSKRNNKISKVVKPAHSAFVAFGGYMYEPPTPRENRIAEELRMKRWKNELYTNPKEYELAMFKMGLGRHKEALKHLYDLLEMQEKRLGIEAPAIGMTYANIAKVLDDQGKSADAVAQYLKALDQLQPGDKKYNQIFEGLAHSLIHSGLSYMEQIGMEALARQHRLLPIVYNKANSISERWNRQRMSKFDEDAAEKPITLTEASSPTDVLSMLNSEDGIELFENFAETEGQRHLVEFWKSVNRLKKLSMKKNTFDIETGEPHDIVHELYETYIKKQTIKCITVKQYRLMMAAAARGDITVKVFDESFKLVFDVLREGMYRRFLVSSFGAQYLWSKTLTERLRMGLIKAQALMRKVLAIKKVIRIRALILRAKLVQDEIEKLRAKDIGAAVTLQRRFRGWMARRRVAKAKEKIQRLHLLHLYVARKRRVIMALRIQNCWRHSVERYPDRLRLRQLICIYFARRWDAMENRYYYWDFRKKKMLLEKPRAMGEDEIPLRVVCYKCEKFAATRYCVVCKDENGPECDNCYFKRHGPDDLTDDVAAAKVLGTESFAMAIPLHRHGWLEFPLQTKICVNCRIRYADRTCDTCNDDLLLENVKDEDEEKVEEGQDEESGYDELSSTEEEKQKKKKKKKHVPTTFVTKLNQNEYCKTCWPIIHNEQMHDVADHEFEKINFRLRQRGMEDLDSDEEGAYRGWSESEGEAEEY